MGALDISHIADFTAFYLTFLAKLSLEAPGADALSPLAPAAAVAVGHLALLVPQGTLAALPPGVALALAIAVLAVGVAQQGAHACGKKRENGVSKLEKLDAVLTNCETSSSGSTKGGGK